PHDRAEPPAYRPILLLGTVLVSCTDGDARKVLESTGSFTICHRAEDSKNFIDVREKASGTGGAGVRSGAGRVPRTTAPGTRGRGEPRRGPRRRRGGRGRARAVSGPRWRQAESSRER